MKRRALQLLTISFLMTLLTNCGGVSQKEYDSWQETSYLLGTKANRDALAEAKESFENKDTRNKILTPEEFEALTKDDEA